MTILEETDSTHDEEVDTVRAAVDDVAVDDDVAMMENDADALDAQTKLNGRPPNGVAPQEIAVSGAVSFLPLLTFEKFA